MDAFELTAAADALAAADEGMHPLPEDANLIARYEEACQKADERRLQQEMDQERLNWLADHFEVCPDIDEGEPCTHLE